MDSETSTRTMSVLVDAAADLASETAGLHILREQRAGPILFAHAAVEVLEDAQARVEPDEIDQLEWAHRVVEPELERLVNVARRGDPFHQHVERLVADAG